MRQNRRNSGFTMVELIIVMVIVAILAAVAATIEKGATTRARVTDAHHNLGALQSAMASYFTANGYLISILNEPTRPAEMKMTYPMPNGYGIGITSDRWRFSVLVANMPEMMVVTSDDLKNASITVTGNYISAIDLIVGGTTYNFRGGTTPGTGPTTAKTLTDHLGNTFTEQAGNTAIGCAYFVGDDADLRGTPYNKFVLMMLRMVPTRPPLLVFGGTAPGAEQVK